MWLTTGVGWIWVCVAAILPVRVHCAPLAFGTGHGAVIVQPRGKLCYPMERYSHASIAISKSIPMSIGTSPSVCVHPLRHRISVKPVTWSTSMISRNCKTLAHLPPRTTMTSSSVIPISTTSANGFCSMAPHHRPSTGARVWRPRIHRPLAPVYWLVLPV